MSKTMKLARNINCDCGCKGWWDYCQENKSNRETFKLSPCPSPCRTDDDWFMKDDNPLCTVKSISVSPNLPGTIIHHISAKYLSSCVDRYFTK